MKLSCRAPPPSNTRSTPKCQSGQPVALSCLSLHARGSIAIHPVPATPPPPTPTVPCGERRATPPLPANDPDTKSAMCILSGGGDGAQTRANSSPSRTPHVSNLECVLSLRHALRRRRNAMLAKQHPLPVLAQNSRQVSNVRKV